SPFEGPCVKFNAAERPTVQRSCRQPEIGTGYITPDVIPAFIAGIQSDAPPSTWPRYSTGNCFLLPAAQPPHRARAIALGRNGCFGAGRSAQSRGLLVRTRRPAH